MTKEEKKEYDKKRYLENKDKLLERMKKYKIENKDVISQYNKKYSVENKDVIAERMKKWRLDHLGETAKYNKEYQFKNKDEIVEHAKEYRLENAVRIAEYNKKYGLENRDKILENRKERYHSDIQFKLALLLRNRLKLALKNNYKKGSAIRDLGCTISELKFYIEGQFQQGMNWENWSFEGWHIDHRIPLAFFDLTDREQLLRAVHYTNLQPMWANDNLKKSDKMNYANSTS